MNDLESNVIDLAERVARAHATLKAQSAAAAAAELDALRLHLLNLEGLLQMSLVHSLPLAKHDEILATLDDIARDMSSLVDAIRHP